MKYTGTVFKGNQYGRTLGFPTANIQIKEEGVSGIFAAHAYLESVCYPAAVYANARSQTLEVHFLDFDRDVYGKEIEVELLSTIREDRVFADENEARATIASDVAAVHAYFAVY